jgi:hypothetical protein
MKANVTLGGLSFKIGRFVAYQKCHFGSFLIPGQDRSTLGRIWQFLL